MHPAPSRVSVDVHLTPDDIARQLRDDVCRGLQATPKCLPPKWFYDDRGSELFDAITRLPEYYPTEAERAILRGRASDIVAASGADTLVELGSGTCDKTRVLLDAMDEAGRLRRYVPFDVSETTLREAAAQLAARHPNLVVDGVVGDFDHHLGRLPTEGRRLVAFLGGTVGNLTPAPRHDLLEDLTSGLDAGEGLLLGTDLVKSEDRLVRAYDDSRGVTAEFNRNVLRVVNRELGADFDPERYEHVARWDVDNEWIEMRLRSLGDQTVTVEDLGLEVGFADGEELVTEISAKFTEDGLRSELAEAGLEVVGWWTDPAEDYALSLSVPAAG